MLFDLEADPDELNDLGSDPAHAEIRTELFGYLNDWARRLSQRITMSPEQVDMERDRSSLKGVLIGAWDENDAPEFMTKGYMPKPAPKGPTD